MGKRVATLIDESKHGTVLIMWDTSATDILPYLYRDGVMEEFKDIRGILKDNLRNREKYCKCDVGTKALDMFEMRFTRNGRNDRIYCKEIRMGAKRFIVMCELYEGKKTQKISKPQKGRIETMGGYEYDLKY